MTELRIGGVTPLTTIDYPGELAAVVFCQGCPWRCRYCHNGHLLERHHAGAIPWPDVLDLLERRRGLLDAVVFSGGEPTAQTALPAAIDQVRAFGFKIGLHTAGCYPRRLEALLPGLDWVGLDVKALPEDYPELTAVRGSGARAWRSLEALVDSGVDGEVRITVHPELLPEDRLRRLVDALREVGARRVTVQRCRTEQVLDPTLSPNDGGGWSGADRRRAV